ncbi:MAG: hypothetical protein KDC67_07700 [Ignavibacteriae bacterium]|nr:hypothetical protein [Ignavibacteriota bacterium]
MKIKKTLTILILVIFSISCSEDLDDNLKLNQDFEAQNAIPTDSELFENLKEITTDDARKDKSIECIDFLYPVTLFVFDDNNQYVETSTISNDDEFSDFLEPIKESYSISISFPITSVLYSGEELIIENKEMLEESINNCLHIEMVGECETLIRECLWKVGYSFDHNNPYLGDILQESDGFLTFNGEDNITIGSWTPFVIEDELHININLIDTTTLAEYFNLDWKAEYTDANSLRLFHEERELILNQRCDPDFAICGDFTFETCETEPESEIGEFMLSDYEFCILDTLELDVEDNNLSINFYTTEDNAINMVDAIVSDQLYTSVEGNQIIYVRINNLGHSEHYFVEIRLVAQSC